MRKSFLCYKDSAQKSCADFKTIEFKGVYFEAAKWVYSTNLFFIFTFCHTVARVFHMTKATDSTNVLCDYFRSLSENCDQIIIH